METLQFDRPTNEDWYESCRAIYKQLKDMGKRPSKIYTRGITNPDGTTQYHAEVK